MKTIVCHGDSLTEGSDLEKSYSWPDLVANKLSLNVINSGIGGDTSGGLLSRFYQDVVRHQPDMVVILGGTNDLWWDVDINSILAKMEAIRCLQCPKPKCVEGCPVGIRIDDFIRAIRNPRASRTWYCVARSVHSAVRR